MRSRLRLFGWGVSIFGLVTLSPALLSQASPEPAAASPLITDWSHHHVIFSRPSTAEQAKRLENDARYRQQQKRLSPARFREVESSNAPALTSEPASYYLRSGKNPKLHRDWSQSLGSGAKVGATNYPAKYFLQTTTANCATAAQPDFVVYGTGLAGSATQASIAAFDNLYSGCTGTVPSVYWAYNTGGTVTTSPVFSRDGTQVAFVQTDGAGHGNLVLLRWAASTTETIGNPTTLTRLPNSSYPGCTAPC